MCASTRATTTLRIRMTNDDLVLAQLCLRAKYLSLKRIGGQQQKKNTTRESAKTNPLWLLVFLSSSMITFLISFFFLRQNLFLLFCSFLRLLREE